MRTDSAEFSPTLAEPDVGECPSTKIFVINLARRTDRLARITRGLARFGLAFERIEAVDAMDVSEELL